jgi:hypothetical protein
MPKSPPALTERFGLVLERFPQLEQRQMFGYPAAFVAAGHLVTSLHGSSWIVRLAEHDLGELRGLGGTDFEPMPGRSMRGFLSLPTDILEDDDAIADWVTRAEMHAASLPPKKPGKRSRA